MGKKRSREQDGLSGGANDKSADKMDEDGSDEEVSPHTDNTMFNETNN